mgnify:FL=1
MSSYKTNNFIKRTSRVISYLLVVLLLLGIVGACAYLFTKPNGIYLRYDGKIVTDKTSGIVIPYKATATFKIENSEDWGAYSVTDCTVKIVPNADESHDFDFTVGDDFRPAAFTKEKDLTGAFVENYNGKGIIVSENGEFTILCSYKSVSEILQAVYGEKEIHAEADGNLLEYPYIAIKVTSPDGKQTLTVPLLLYGFVTGIKLNPSEVIF